MLSQALAKQWLPLVVLGTLAVLGLSLKYYFS